MSDERLAQIRARLSDEWPDGEGVECVPGKCGGAPCLVGTRWPVIIWWQCLESFETPDATDAAVLAAYDWLTPEQVATARAYCLANQLPFIARREFNHHAANVIDLYRDDVPYLIQALADAEARLATLAALDPIVRYGSGWYACHFCDQEHNHRNVTHAEDCSWVLATGIRAAKGGDDDNG